MDYRENETVPSAGVMRSGVRILQVSPPGAPLGSHGEGSREKSRSVSGR